MPYKTERVFHICLAIILLEIIVVLELKIVVATIIFYNPTSDVSETMRIIKVDFMLSQIEA
jgi:hypothetical protein